MNNKILLGSIIAVVILVLVSFTGVVGYQTTSSTITKASPLFTVRSKRAIGQGQQDITANYLGHGEKTNIHLSSRTKRAEQTRKAIDIISKMDDKAFSRFVARIILHLKNQEQMTDKETSDVLQTLHNIRKNPNYMKYYDTKDNPISDTSEYWSCGVWRPGCIIREILANFLGWVSLIILSIITHLVSCFPKCKTIGCPL